MARPTKQATLNANVENAENEIRANLPELIKVLLDTALNAPLRVTCDHCRKPFDVKRVGDPKVAMTLVERVAGKATEKKQENSTTAVERLLTELAGGASAGTPQGSASAKTPAQQAAEALALANTRAALRAAAVNP